MEAMINGYEVYAMDSDGAVWSISNYVWHKGHTPTRYMTAAFARHMVKSFPLPENTVDAYIWSTEHEVSFPIFLRELALVSEALEMGKAGEICYENLEILNRLPLADWQRQFLGEAKDLQPREFADLVRGVLRRNAWLAQ